MAKSTSSIPAAQNAMRLYYDLVETSQDLIWQCDAEGRYTFLNPAWETVFGYTTGEMLGRRFSDFQNSDMARRDMEEFTRLLHGGTVRGYETIHKAKSGADIHLSFSAKFVRDDTGAVIGTRGTAVDISERKRSETALQQNEFFLSKALQIGNIGHFSLDPATTIMEGSEELFRIFDIDRSKPLFEGFAAAVHPDDDHLIFPLIDRTIREGIPYDVGYRVRHRDGLIRYVNARGELIDTPLGKRMVGTVQDITRRVEMENALRESEKKFARAFQCAPVLMSITDLATGVYLDVNDEAIRVSGFSRNEIIGNTAFGIGWITPEQRTMLVNEVRTHGRIDNLEMNFRCKDGHIITGIIKGEIIISAERDCLLTVTLDITEFKKMQDELIKTQKLESLGILAGGIAHDFNNLLGGIFGYIDIAAGESKPEKIKRNLAKAMNTIDRARGLTQQLLTFAKGGAPAKTLDRLFPFVAETARFALSGSRVTCVCSVPDDLWACEFDRNQIGQVIDNIVINAQQSMPDGGQVEISAANVTFGDHGHPTLPPGDYVRISVRDHGVGMPAEILPRIFDPFYTTKPRGHGLGLATCYSIINRHEGCIDVESSPGTGSVFTIHLKAQPGRSADEAAEHTSRHAGKGRAIIMDDEEVMCDIIGEMLQSFGYSVVCTDNGEAAIRALRAEPAADAGDVSFMVVDLTIQGGRGGKEIIPDIRSINSRLPVFVMSGYSNDPVMAHPQDFGFIASICKPFTKGDLAALLAEYLPG